MNRRSFWVGLVILLGIPLLVLLAFDIYARWEAARPQDGLLECRVVPPVKYPWNEANYVFTFRGDKGSAPSVPVTNVDIVFLIDVSGSMHGSLDDMAEAAHEVAEELKSEMGENINFALIRFDTEAEVNTDWTSDPKNLYAGLKNLKYWTGQNDTREAFRVLEQVLGRARSGARKVAVFYTDGGLAVCPPSVCPDGPMSHDEMVAAAEELRRRGIEIYSIGLPGVDSHPLMIRMTGSASRVFDPARLEDLVANFRYLAHSLVPAYGEAAQLSLRLDGRHFGVRGEDGNWYATLAGDVRRDIGRLPLQRVDYELPLEPKSLGLWHVGLAPGRLTFVDDSGTLQEIDGPRRPVLLVVTWLMLFLALLPALIWILYHLLKKERPKEEEPRPVPEILRELPPSRLPELPRPVRTREEVIPTLFVGLGGAGRRAIRAIRAELKEAHAGQSGQPYAFFGVDLDKNPVKASEVFGEWAGQEYEEIIAPQAVQGAGGYIPTPGSVPDHLLWFPDRKYIDTPREDLNLADGTKGDRILARLALYSWLSRPDGELLPAMQRHCEEICRLPSVDGTRQIVVAASRDGGVGTGWFLDCARVLRRICRRLQESGEVEFVPEIIGILSDDAERERPENRMALTQETETAALAGGYPQRVIIAPDHENLDATDTESSYNWVFSLGGASNDSVASQCGDMAALLVERRPRTLFLDQATHASESALIRCRSRSANVLPTLLQEQVYHQILLRLFGPDILMDIEPSPEGGFARRGVPDEESLDSLRRWTDDAVAGTPLQLVLANALDRQNRPLLEAWLKKEGPPSPEYMGTALCASITKKLHGKRETREATWQRIWMPSQAIGVLRLLKSRLEDELLPEITEGKNAQQVREIVSHLLETAGGAADALETWMTDLCEALAEAASKRPAVEKLKEALKNLESREYIDPPVAESFIEDETRRIFEAWLETEDISGALRERVFFAVSREANGISVALRSYVEGIEDYSEAEAAFSVFRGYAHLLAQSAPSLRIGDALENLTDDRSSDLARNLVETASQAEGTSRQVHIMFPRSDPSEPVSAAAMAKFLEEIPDQAGQGDKVVSEGDDQSGVRRFRLGETSLAASETPCFVGAPEMAAARLRERIERVLQKRIPEIPPLLRIALAHVEEFRSFAEAYEAGYVTRKTDEAGREQWYLEDRDQFLTFGVDESLAAAAANYVWYVHPAPKSFTPREPGGDFSSYEVWCREGGYPDENTVVLAAIRNRDV
jgi:hypothetical protein